MTAISIPVVAGAMVGPRSTFSEQLRRAGVPKGSKVTIRDGQLTVGDRPRTSSMPKQKSKSAKFTADELRLGPNLARVAAGVKFRKPKKVAP